MSERYRAVEGSETSSYGFGATVIDTQIPHPAPSGHDWICQCYNFGDAQKIADALNAAEQAGGDE